jgi:hypothetical protein
MIRNLLLSSNCQRARVAILGEGLAATRACDGASRAAKRDGIFFFCWLKILALRRSLVLRGTLWRVLRQPEGEGFFERVSVGCLGG